MVGIVALEFAVAGGQTEIFVPFPVTTERLSNPIVRYVIENLVVSGKEPELLTCSRDKIQNVYIGKIEVMLNIMNRK